MSELLKFEVRKGGFAKLVGAIWGFGVLKVASWMNAKNALSVAGLVSVVGLIALLIGGDKGGATLKDWMEGSVTMVMVPLISLSFAGGIIRSEIREGTIEYLWTRPISKSQLMISGYVCSVFGVLLVVALLDLLLILILFTKGGHLGLGEFLNLVVAQTTGVIAFNSLALAVASIFQKYMIVGVVYGLLVEVGIGSLPSNIALVAVSHHLENIISSEEMLGSMGFCFLITVLALLVSMIVFRTKSYEMGIKGD